LLGRHPRPRGGVQDRHPLELPQAAYHPHDGRARALEAAGRRI